ncbi:DEAD/DEAH box helicase [Geoalkalibacter halelectricus]|uniref:DEAD/DEAH box helicase n=1 Tax=Geoalkalibacter halelectricus TaxID=2847045 RepID=A0ABY5ZM56_9BACT|nr:DEAD/DEAH box helicase [Geoalkalibacter halelectricus]MDO3378935.1 DEAD/DEAH box helicase [Geoalkalibacter halelectricus]UWZ79042.1 DEAD/DEAH box helicase [Geoalkalibacter halelectricus]
MSFTAFSFHPQVAAGIDAAGYTAPTPIQTQAIPQVLQGRDVMGLAQTGTGKTAAFALPILNRLLPAKSHRLRALIIAPTRELAEQINDSFITLGRQTRLRSITVYGGVGINPQISKLKQGTEIVVACPGRLLDHIDQGTIDLSHLEVLVLDEADQMFDMGFFPAIRRILKHLPSNRQTLLFSATMPTEIRRLAQEILRDPVTVQVGNVAPATTVSHALYPVAQHLKTPLLLDLLGRTDTGSVLVFTRTKHRAKRLGEQLGKAGYRAASLQGNLSQNKRQAALEGFRDGSFQILVATDIAARGIDVSQVSHVVNYDIPDTPEAYIHRIGRTGRAARSGDAYTLVTEDDGAMIRAIERTLGKAIERRTVAAFDYAVAAPVRDQEFARPPRQPAPRRKPEGASASRAAATSKPAGDGQKRRQPDVAGRSSAAPPAAGNRRRRSRGSRSQAQKSGV